MEEEIRLDLTYLGVSGDEGMQRDQYAGATWSLTRKDGVWRLTTHDGRLASEFQDRELYDHIWFPSFWMSNKELGVRSPQDQVGYCFRPDPEIVARLREVHRANEQQNPEYVAKYERTIAWIELPGGLTFLLLGIAGLVLCWFADQSVGRDQYAYVFLGSIAATLFGLFVTLSSARRLWKVASMPKAISIASPEQPLDKPEQPR